MDEIIASLEQDMNVQNATISELTESLTSRDEKIASLETQVQNAESQLEDATSELYSGYITNSIHFELSLFIEFLKFTL